MCVAVCVCLCVCVCVCVCERVWLFFMRRSSAVISWRSPLAAISWMCLSSAGACHHQLSAPVGFYDCLRDGVVEFLVDGKAHLSNYEFVFLVM